MYRFSSLWTLWFAALGAAPLCLATDRDATKSHPTAPAASAEQIAGWIRQLDSPRFAERTEATRQLEEAGKAAFPALAEAALGESREVTLRAIEILRKHGLEGDELTKTAAKDSLQKIADSEHASAARRAKDALKPPQSPPSVPNVRLGPIMPNLPIGQQQIQVQIQVNAFGGNQTRRIKINNGVRQIEVTENDLKVKITEDAQGGIQMEVTRKKDGKETTEKYAAKSAGELKKTNPDAGKLYDKYQQQAGAAIQIQALPGMPATRRAIPVPPIPK